MRRKPPPPLSTTQEATLLWVSSSGVVTESEITESVGTCASLNALIRRSLLGVTDLGRIYATERGRLVAARLRSSVAATARADG